MGRNLASAGAALPIARPAATKGASDRRPRVSLRDTLWPSEESLACIPILEMLEAAEARCCPPRREGAAARPAEGMNASAIMGAASRMAAVVEVFIFSGATTGVDGCVPPMDPRDVLSMLAC